MGRPYIHEHSKTPKRKEKENGLELFGNDRPSPDLWKVGATIAAPTPSNSAQTQTNSTTKGPASSERQRSSGSTASSTTAVALSSSSNSSQTQTTSAATQGPTLSGRQENITANTNTQNTTVALSSSSNSAQTQTTSATQGSTSFGQQVSITLFAPETNAKSVTTVVPGNGSGANQNSEPADKGCWAWLKEHCCPCC
jgi:hypothetical protein